MLHFMIKILQILVLTIFIFSCSSDLDFKQAKDVLIEPVIVSNLASFDLNANEFNLGEIPKTSFENVSNFELFKDTSIKKNLIKIQLLFQINNTIKEDFDFELVLLDQANSPVYFFKIPVPAYSGNEKLILETLYFENNLDVLTNARKISFSIKLSSGTGLPNSSSGSLMFRSTLTGYFKIE